MVRMRPRSWLAGLVTWNTRSKRSRDAPSCRMFAGNPIRMLILGFSLMALISSARVTLPSWLRSQASKISSAAALQSALILWGRK